MIEREVHSKLGKEEFAPMREALSEKLKTFQDKLTVLTSLREQAEAAGAKRKLLKYVITVIIVLFLHIIKILQL